VLAVHLFHGYGAMNLKSFLDREFSEHQAGLQATRDSLCDPFMALCAVADKVLHGGKKFMFMGDGGSAVDAQHLAAELVVRYNMDCSSTAALALTTDSTARIQEMHIFLGHLLCDLSAQRCGQ